MPPEPCRRQLPSARVSLDQSCSKTLVYEASALWTYAGSIERRSLGLDIMEPRALVPRHHTPPAQHAFLTSTARAPASNANPPPVHSNSPFISSPSSLHSRTMSCVRFVPTSSPCVNGLCLASEVWMKTIKKFSFSNRLWMP